ATAPYELWHLTLEDAIETTGRAFMGLTLRCARCHDHKFDPVTKEDYYALYGIFASTQFPWAGGEEFHSMKKPPEHFMPLHRSRELDQKLAAFSHQGQELELQLRIEEKKGPRAVYIAQLDQLLAAKAQSIRQLETRNQSTEALQAERAALQRERDRTNGQLQARLAILKNQLWELRRSSLPVGVAGAYAVQEGRPQNAAIHVRGDVTELGRVVTRGVPKFLCREDQPVRIPDKASGRLELAEWLLRPEHPLTARVMVNRILQHHFSKGIVGTPSNFCLRGEDAKHLELL